MKESYIYTSWNGDDIGIILSNCLIDVMHSWDSTGARISWCTSTVKLEGHWRVVRRCRIILRAQENNTDSKTVSFMWMSFSCGDIVLPCFTLTCGKQWLQLPPQYPPKPYPLPTSSLVFLQGQQTINYTLSTNLLEHAYITFPCLYHISLQHVTSNTWRSHAIRNPFAHLQALFDTEKTPPNIDQMQCPTSCPPKKIANNLRGPKLPTML